MSLVNKSTNSSIISFKSLMKIALFLLSIYLLFQIKSIVSILIFSVVVSFLLNPSLVFFSKYKIPRIIGIFILILIAFFVMVIVVLILLPTLIGALISTINVMPELLENVYSSISLDKQSNISAFIAESLNKTIEYLNQNAGETVQKAFAIFGDNVLSITKFVSKLPSFFLYLGVFFVLTLYFLKDYELIKKNLFHAIDNKYSLNLEEYHNKISNRVVDYFQGQLLVITYLGVGYAIALFIGGVPAGIALGLIFGFLSLIPYVGGFLAFTIGIALSASANLDIWHPLITLIGLCVVQSGESYFVTPKVMQNRLALHPTIVIFSIVVGGVLFGMLGMLMALPVAAIIKEAISDYLYDRPFVQKSIK